MHALSFPTSRIRARAFSFSGTPSICGAPIRSKYDTEKQHVIIFDSRTATNLHRSWARVLLNLGVNQRCSGKCSARPGLGFHITFRRLGATRFRVHSEGEKGEHGIQYAVLCQDGDRWRPGQGKPGAPAASMDWRKLYAHCESKVNKIPWHDSPTVAVARGTESSADSKPSKRIAGQDQRRYETSSSKRNRSLDRGLLVRLLGHAWCPAIQGKILVVASVARDRHFHVHLLFPPATIDHESDHAGESDHADNQPEP